MHVKGVEVGRREGGAGMEWCRGALLLLVMLLWSASRTHFSQALVEKAATEAVPFGVGIVIAACKATRYPQLCISSLSGNPTPANLDGPGIIKISMSVGLTASQNDYATVNRILNAFQVDINASAAAVVCLEVLEYSATQLQSSQTAFLVNPIADIQTWLSASLAFHYDCYSAVNNLINPPAEIASLLLELTNTEMLLSNSLALTNAFATYGASVYAWQPAPEQRPASIFSYSSYPQWLSTNDTCVFHSPQISQLANVTVSLDPSSTMRSIQQAVDSAPSFSSQRFVIYIKEGVYYEKVRVPINKPFIMFVGDGDNKSVITGSDFAKPGHPTFLTATVVVAGKGFIARGITFQNSAGPNVHQAVAIRVDGDMSAFQDCLFDGYQDTLYAHSQRQFYSACTILGTVDYIFGNSAALFQNCQILTRLGSTSTSINTLTAHGRTDPGQATGFLFQNCAVTGTSDYLQQAATNPSMHKTYLGRPWKQFSRTFFFFSSMDFTIEAQGWCPWIGDFALSTLYYGEYGNFGTGANSAARVPWSNQLSLAQEQLFTADSFIEGNCWLPSFFSSSSSLPLRWKT